MKKSMEILVFFCYYNNKRFFGIFPEKFSRLSRLKQNSFSVWRNLR